MAFYDWNHDGKKDLVDDYLEYNIYKESMKNSDSTGSDSPGSRVGCSEIMFFAFLIFCFILYLISLQSEQELPELILYIKNRDTQQTLHAAVSGADTTNVSKNNTLSFEEKYNTKLS